MDNHKLFTNVAHFAEGSVIKSEPQMAVLQSLALVGGYQWKTFGTSDMKKLFNETDVENEVFKEANKSFDFLFEVFPEYTKFLTKVFLPACVALVVNNDFDKDIIPFLQDYVVSNKKGDPYRHWSSGSTTKKENVEGRIKGLQQLFEKFKEENSGQQEMNI
ncbi:hypothetical protein BSK59_13230 [Paenibacillus odorifer]|nr:hypothetical protein BSK59_13230 [Paenibacillus odorifer]